MIKLTNGQAIQMFSPAVDAVFGNPDNKFPVAAGHLLLVGVEKIRREFKNLPEDNDAVLNKYGTVDEKTKKMVYDPPENQALAQAELNELYAIEREINVKKVKVNDNFPALSGFEIQILNPLLDFGDE